MPSQKHIEADRPGRKPTSRTSRNLKRAAKLRVQGATWQTIATAIHRNGADSARRLTQEYPAEWAEEMESAEAEYADQYRGEAVATLHELQGHQLVACDHDGEPIRTKGGRLVIIDVPLRIRKDAARALLDYDARRRAKAPEQHVTVPVSVGVDNSTSNLTDAELLDACRAVGIDLPPHIADRLVGTDRGPASG